MTRYAVALALVVFAIIPALADDAKTKREREVKVALALSGADADRCNERCMKVAAALKLADCNCEVTGDCNCKPGSCGCCSNLPPLVEQEKRAREKGLPLVGYYGCKGHCVDGAIVGGADVLPTGHALKAGLPIVVWYMSPRGWMPASQLPASATADQVADAVTRAKALQLAACANGKCPLK